MSNKKGFSGLDDLGTDIDDIISENHKNIKNNTEQKTEFKGDKTTSNDNEIEDIEKSKSASSNKSNISNVANSDSKNGSSSWIWWLLAFGVFGWIITQSNTTSSSSNKTSYSSPSQQNYSLNTQSDNYSKTSSDDYYESKPDAFVSILNKNQLLYCKAEKIRLDAVQNKIDLYSKYEVDKYNSLLNDYNSRCPNKQYYKDDKYYVYRNINKKRYELQQEGLARFSKSSPLSSSIKHKLIYSLTVNAVPYDARIRIMNIKPKYYDGIKLKKGKYRIEVSKNGYKTVNKWIMLSKDTVYSIELKKNKFKRLLQYRY